MVSEGYELQFISYPSEMHLWEGLLDIENKRGIFFSSDLVFQFGKAAGAVIEGEWQSAIESVTKMQVPDPEGREQLKKELAEFYPKFVATGHGPCQKLK